MSTLKSIEGLLEKPVYMMTGEEYLELTHYALANSPNAANRPTQAGQKALGVHALAVERIYYLRADARAARGGRIQCRRRCPAGSDRLSYRPTDRLRRRQGPQTGGRVSDH